MSVRTDKYETMWFEERERFLKKLFPTAKYNDPCARQSLIQINVKVT